MRFDVDKTSSVRSVNVRSTNNFGLEWKELNQVYSSASKTYENVAIKGISVKIVSRAIVDSGALQIVVKRLLTIVEVLRNKGHIVEVIDFTSSDYNYVYNDTEQLEDFVGGIKRYLDESGCKFLIGLSSSITEGSGVALSSVVLVQSLPQRSYVILDSSFGENLYKSDFAVMPIEEKSENTARMNVVCDVNGRQETILKKVMLSKDLKSKDMVAVTGVSYMCVLMGSIVNSSPMPEVVMIKDGKVMHGDAQRRKELEIVENQMMEDAV